MLIIYETHVITVGIRISDGSINGFNGSATNCNGKEREILNGRIILFIENKVFSKYYSMMLTIEKMKEISDNRFDPLFSTLNYCIYLTFCKMCITKSISTWKLHQS